MEVGVQRRVTSHLKTKQQPNHMGFGPELYQSDLVVDITPQGKVKG